MRFSFQHISKKSEMILVDEKPIFPWFFLGFFIPKPKNKDRLEETNKQKTKVKPNIHKFWLKPSGLFQKMFFFVLP